MVEKEPTSHKNPSPDDSATVLHDHGPAAHIALGSKIGHYTIREVLGEGGFAVVYLAEQTEPVRRRVALKVIKLGMDTKQVIARFEAERQALAMMDHPNVARVFDAGVTDDGRSYFVMEHVPGVPITDHCDRQRLNIEQRLQLFMSVCDAVQHAHQKGIIHRDIKPSNVLVSTKEGSAVPKVIDFGVAKALHQKLTERTLFTEQGQLIGTPEYMSPEQAEMTAQDIDTRSDIYSLGVLLYELLTGALPFDPKSLRKAAFVEIQRIIREQEPPKPSTKLSSLGDASTTNADNRRLDPRSLTRELRGELDWIVMKALEKDREHRYETANGFASDIRRHLSHEPVLAGPPSAAYRMSKFVRRNRRSVVGAGIIVVVLLAATAVSIGFAVSEAQQRRIAQAAEREQNRARQEAEEARTAEQEQRKLAEQREAEAVAARAEVQQRADELKTVTKFQSSMLSGIDAQVMGRAIVKELRESIRERLEADNAPPQKIEAAIASFDELAAQVNATDLAQKVVDEQVFSRAVESIEQEFADQPLVEAALRQTVGNTYHKLGLYPQAMPQMERALKVRRRVLGDDHPDTLMSILSMGNLLESMGKYAEAEPLLREAVDGTRHVLGDDDPMTLRSINSMGSLLESMGKYAEAEPLLREALEGSRRVLGDDDPNTLRSINNMGGLLWATGKLPEAERYFREALETRRRVLGDDHSKTLGSINNMAVLLKSMGKLEEAEPYFREALDGFRRVLGDANPDTLMSINNMGHLLRDMGRLKQAEALGAEAVRGAKERLGNDHFRTLLFLTSHGRTLAVLGRFEQGKAELLEAYEGLSDTRPPGDQFLVRCVTGLVELYSAWDEAEPDKGYDAKAADWRAKLPEPDESDADE